MKITSNDDEADVRLSNAVIKGYRRGIVEGIGAALYAPFLQGPPYTTDPIAITSQAVLWAFDLAHDDYEGYMAAVKSLCERILDEAVDGWHDSEEEA